MSRNGGDEVGSPTEGGMTRCLNILCCRCSVRGRSDPFLVVCRCFSFVTCLAAILCIVVNILSAIRSFKNGYDVFDGIFRCYAVALIIFVIIAETEWGFFLKFCKVLQYWVARGILQIFVAVMTRAFPDTSSHKNHFILLLEDIACYALLACGVIYIISGILCMGWLKQSRMRKEISREQAVRDLEELQRQREELEQLLLEERV